MQPSNEVATVIKIARHAAGMILSHYKQALNVTTKENDPYNFLTQADTEADKYIGDALQKAFPADQILTEESRRPKNYQGRVWMVDPLDGTKEFINGGTRFSVMIGLCLDGKPILGCCVAPTDGVTYWAEKGKGAYAITKDGRITKLHVAPERKFADARVLLANLWGEPRPAETLLAGTVAPKNRLYDASFAQRAAMVATGQAEFFVNTNVRAGKWDFCAPQVILEEAAGTVTDIFGHPLDYTSPDLRWPASFVASGGVDHAEVIRAIAGIEKYVTIGDLSK